MATKTDRNGKTTTYSYDTFGKLENENVAGEIKSYTYDNNGNQLTMTDSTGTTTRTYDEQNRVTSKTVPHIGKTVFTYDLSTEEPGIAAEGTTDPKGNTIEKVYDKAGRLSSVTTAGKTTTYTYYANGNRQSVIYPNGTSEHYSYNKDNKVTLLENKKSDGTLLQSYTYTYDEAGNQTSKTEAKGTTSYSYDSLNRLSKVTEPTGKQTSYTYDKAGNRKTEAITAGKTTVAITYTYNEQNRLTQTETVSAGKTEKTIYVYDNNGNLKSKNKSTLTTATPTPTESAKTSDFGIEIKRSTDQGTGTKDISLYSYDNYNRLTKLIEGDTTSTYAYNAEDYRVEKTVNNKLTRYLYEADKVVLETDGTGTETARNVYGTNLLYRSAEANDTAPAEQYYYLYNAHGDVTALADTEGAISATYDYDVFGNIISQTGNANNSITYAGYQYDKETDLYYLNARYYDSKTARFLTEDTYAGQASDPLSLNLYSYCYNEPIMYVDITGHYNESANLTINGITLDAGVVEGTTYAKMGKVALAIDPKANVTDDIIEIHNADTGKLVRIKLNGYAFSVRMIAKLAGVEDTLSWWVDDKKKTNVTIQTSMNNAAVQVTRAGDTINIKAYVKIGGNAEYAKCKDISPSYNGTTYHDLAIQGFRQWGTYYENINRVDFEKNATYANINGQSVKIYMNVIDYDKSSEGLQKIQKNWLNVNIQKNDPKDSRVYRPDNNPWSMGNCGNMTLDVQETIRSNDVNSGYSFKMYAAHEFGHILGIDDAYADKFGNVKKTVIYRNRGEAPVTLEVPINDMMRGGQVVTNNHKDPKKYDGPIITDNDYEMLWNAWITNSMQSFVDYDESIHGSKGNIHHTKSKVITVPAKK